MAKILRLELRNYAFVGGQSFQLDLTLEFLWMANWTTFLQLRATTSSSIPGAQTVRNVSSVMNNSAKEVSVLGLRLGWMVG